MPQLHLHTRILPPAVIRGVVVGAGWDALDVIDEWTVERHTAGASEEVRALYERFIALVGRCGPFTYRVTKSGITLKGPRRGFAGAVLRRNALGGYFDITRQVSDPRILRSSPYTSRLYVHQFRVTGPDQLDDEFAGWLAEAYAVGQGAHLRR